MPFVTYWITSSLKWTGGMLIIWFSFIYSLSIIRNNRSKELERRSGIKDIDKMTGKEFEAFLADVFKKKGYSVKTTPITQDFGADLILTKQNRVIVVQAKRHKNTVGIESVQQVIPAVAHYKANESWVVTNSYFTKSAYKLAKSNNVRLINRDELMKMISDIKTA